MTIQNTTLRKAGPSQGNGVTTVFPFTFKVFTSTDILVTYLNASSVESVLVLTTNYTVSLNADQNTSPGGSVTLLVAPATGTYITLTSQVANTQTLALTNSGGFYPESINNALDRTVIEIQQLAEELSRTLKFPKSDSSALSSKVPSSSVRANKYLTFDSSGNPTVSANDIEYYSDLAVASAASALTSKTSATASASSAAASATSAAASESQVIATAASVTPSITNFSGDGVTTAFTLYYSVSDKNRIDVFISGVYQQKSKFSVTSGTTLTFVSAPASGTNNIEVKTAANLAYAVPSSYDYGLITSSATSFADYGAIT